MCLSSVTVRSGTPVYYSYHLTSWQYLYVMKRKSIIIIAFTTLSCLIIIIKQAYYLSSIKHLKTPASARAHSKYILLWTDHFYDFNLKWVPPPTHRTYLIFIIKLSRQYVPGGRLDGIELLSFKTFQCPVHQCYLTSDRYLIKWV